MADVRFPESAVVSDLWPWAAYTFVLREDILRTQHHFLFFRKHFAWFPQNFVEVERKKRGWVELWHVADLVAPRIDWTSCPLMRLSLFTVLIFLTKADPQWDSQWPHTALMHCSDELTTEGQQRRVVPHDKRGTHHSMFRHILYKTWGFIRSRLTELDNTYQSWIQNSIIHWFCVKVIWARLPVWLCMTNYMGLIIQY